MRYEDDRLLELAIQLTEHVQHNFGILRIESACRFVRQQDSWTIYHRACDCNALLFTAG